jgi:hypothetical protein
VSPLNLEERLKFSLSQLNVIHFEIKKKSNGAKQCSTISLILACSAPHALQVWPPNNFAKTKNGTLV